MNPNHAKGYEVQKWNSILDLYVEVCLKINRLDCFIMVIWNRLHARHSWSHKSSSQFSNSAQEVVETAGVRQ